MLGGGSASIARSSHVVVAGACCSTFREKVGWNGSSSIVFTAATLFALWLISGRQLSRSFALRLMAFACVMLAHLVPGMTLLSARLDAPELYLNHDHDLLDLLAACIEHDGLNLGRLIFFVAMLQTIAAACAACGWEVEMAVAALVVSVACVPAIVAICYALDLHIMQHGTRGPYQIMPGLAGGLLAAAAVLDIFSLPSIRMVMCAAYHRLPKKSASAIALSAACVGLLRPQELGNFSDGQCTQLSRIKLCDDFRSSYVAGLPFVVSKIGERMPRWERFSDLTELCAADAAAGKLGLASLRNARQEQVVSVLSRLPRASRLAANAYLGLRALLVGGPASLDSIISGYPRTMEAALQARPNVPHGSSWLDWAMAVVFPEVFMLTDWNFETIHLVEQCAEAAEALNRSCAALPFPGRVSSDDGSNQLARPYLFFGWGKGHGIPAHLHYEQAERQEVWWSWQVFGRKRWTFWRAQDGDALGAGAQEAGSRLYHFSPNGWARLQNWLYPAASGTPCWTTTLQAGDGLVFPTTFIHEVYALELGGLSILFRPDVVSAGAHERRMRWEHTWTKARDGEPDVWGHVCAGGSEVREQ